MTIYLVRHGQTRWNVERRMQGRGDSPLTLLGLRQIQGYAALLKSRLDHDDVELWASPLPRAQQTASVIAETLGLQTARYHADALLAERDCGRWEGHHWDDVAAHFGDQAETIWRSWDARIDGDVEPLQEVQARAMRFLERPRSARTTIVVTHGVLSRGMRAAYLDLNPGGLSDLPRHTQNRLFRLEGGTIKTVDVPVEG